MIVEKLDSRRFKALASYARNPKPVLSNNEID